MFGKPAPGSFIITKKTVDRADFHLNIVQEISDLVNKSTCLNTILRKVVNKIACSLHFDVVSVYLWDRDNSVLRLRATKGLNVDPMKTPITLSPAEGLTGLVYETSRAITVMPASEHPRYRYFPEIGEEEYESYIGVPIILQNRCIGVLVGQTKDKRLINPAEETLFQIIASRLAGLLEVGWAIGLKYTHGFSRFWPSVATVLSMVLSLGLLAHALKTLPIGTAYAVWTGIGTVGTALLGIALFAEPYEFLRVACILLIVIGIAGLRLLS